MASRPPADDPASLDQAIPDADRGQGTMQPLPEQAIGEAAREGVDVDDEADDAIATTAGSLTREAD